jgi:hypothetical protein
MEELQIICTPPCELRDRGPLDISSATVSTLDLQSCMFTGRDRA